MLFKKRKKLAEMRRDVILILTGRGMSRQSRELLESATELEKQEEEEDDNYHRSCNGKKINHPNPFPSSGNNTLPMLYCDDAASTTVSQSGVSVVSDSVISSYEGCDPSYSSALKVKTFEDSLQQSFSNNSTMSCNCMLSSDNNWKPKVRFSRVTVHYHSINTFYYSNDLTCSTFTGATTSTSRNDRHQLGEPPNPVLSLGWKRLESENFENIDQYEMARQSRRAKRHRLKESKGYRGRLPSLNKPTMIEDDQRQTSSTFDSTTTSSGQENTSSLPTQIRC